MTQPQLPNRVESAIVRLAPLRGLPAAIIFNTAVAAFVVARNNHGEYVGDNRFDQYWTPGWRLARETSLWDASRGLGRVGEEFWPLSLPIAVLRSLGISAHHSQLLWHIFMLSVAATGLVMLLRTIQPKVGFTHVVAGLAYAYSPYSLTFFLPTNLYWSFAIAPWLLAASREGTRSPKPWRWAALFALAIAIGGDTDPPGLFFAALWVLPMLAFDVWIDRTVTRKAALAWLFRAGCLTFWASLAALVKVAIGSGALAQRLLTTESAAEVSRTSSWTESWRGLGFWVSYFSTPGADPNLPGSTAWYETLPGALATFALPVIALVAIGYLKWRQRLFWAGLAFGSLTIMVGVNAANGLTPLGDALTWAYGHLPGTASFRTTYKAGSGAMIAVAVLVATTASAYGTRLKKRDARLRNAPLAAVALLVFMTAIPVWSGGLYPEDRELDEIAPHWVAASKWFEQQPGNARVLVLPGSTQTAYRWGWAGDDILDALFRRHPNLVPTNFPISTPLSADIVDAIERSITAGTLSAHDLAVISARLNVGWIILRNDLDWARTAAPRPQILDPLRDSQDLPLVKTFGANGLNTTDRHDQGPEATGERELPPIEVLKVAPLGLTRNAAPPTVVDGSGDAWPTLASLGYLDGNYPLTFAGTRNYSELLKLIADGSPLVVTDSNRRKVTLIRGPGPVSTGALGLDASPGPVEPSNIFSDPKTQAVAVYGDAAEISSNVGENDVSKYAPWFRPALAFDKDINTSWRTGSQTSPIGTSLQVEFKQPTTLSRLKLIPIGVKNDQRHLAEVQIEFGSTSKTVKIDGAQAAEVDLGDPVTATDFKITVTKVAGEGHAPVGFAEINLPEVDVRERIKLPTYITDSGDSKLQSGLRNSNLAFVMSRSRVTKVEDESTFDEERALRRVVTMPSARTLNLSGTLQGGATLSDRAVDSLIGSSLGAYGDSRVGLPSEARGGLAVDGDPLTGWRGRAHDGAELNVRFPKVAVRTVSVRIGSGPSDFPLDQLEVLVEGKATPMEVKPSADCDDVTCDRFGLITLRGAQTTNLKLRFKTPGAGSRSLNVLEVALNDNPFPDVTSEACSGGVIAVDGKTVGARIEAENPTEVLDENVVHFSGCQPVDLEKGDHTVESTDGATVNSVRLATSDVAAPGDTKIATATVTKRAPGVLNVRLDSSGAVYVLTGQSYDPDWEATLNGNGLGQVTEIDGQSAWLVGTGNERSLDMRYAKQGSFRFALALSGLGFGFCILTLILGGEFWKRERSR